jgi:hypothetical protein
MLLEKVVFDRRVKAAIWHFFLSWGGTKRP